MKQFVGRKKELNRLKQYQKQHSGSLIVIRGRRRIGKSCLAEQFAKNMHFIKISGLPPTEHANAQDQRTHFADMLVKYGLSRPNDDNWYNLFLHLAQNLPSSKTVVLFDEISWMAADDPTFLPKLKDTWDDYFKKNANLVMILCGSVSSWIDKNILSSTAFLGRINERITLDEMNLSESLELLSAIGFKGSHVEKFLILSITGGVPWYIEQFIKGNTAERHLKRLCFSKDGLLVNEFNHIFHDLFKKRAHIYSKITSTLKNGPKEYSDLAKLSEYESSGTLSEYLKDLTTAGFIQKDKTWSLKTGYPQNIFRYRLSDNYLRFYLRYIEPNLTKIHANHFEETSITTLKGFQSITGLQLENLILSNKQIIFDELGIKRQNILNDNPYFQRAGKTQKGCQIDYMIQTEFNTLFICEIKYTSKSIGIEVIDEIKMKIARLKKPKYLACLPVLIHFGDLCETLEESDFFYKVIDIRQYLF